MCNVLWLRKLALLSAGMVALGYINEAIDEGNPLKTLDTLLLPTANIRDVDPDCAQHYQDVLFHTKSQKLLVCSRIWKFARGKTFDSFVINLMSFLSQWMRMETSLFSWCRPLEKSPDPERSLLLLHWICSCRWSLIQSAVPWAFPVCPCHAQHLVGAGTAEDTWCYLKVFCPYSLDGQELAGASLFHKEWWESKRESGLRYCAKNLEKLPWR